MNSDVWLYHCLLFLHAAKPTGQWMQSVGVGVGVGTILNNRRMLGPIDVKLIRMCIFSPGPCLNKNPITFKWISVSNRCAPMTCFLRLSKGFGFDNIHE